MGWKNTKRYGNFLEIIKKFISENELEGIPFEDIGKFLWLYGFRENRKREFEKL